jgi:hypothetical protein
MPKKRLNDLEPGMTLAADVANLHGQTLFKAGLRLGSRQIEILQMWGIQSVDIEGEEEREDRLDLSRFAPQTLARAERQVALRFRGARAAHPAVDVIRGICVLEAAKAIAREEAAR